MMLSWVVSGAPFFPPAHLTQGGCRHVWPLIVSRLTRPKNGMKSKDGGNILQNSLLFALCESATTPMWVQYLHTG